MAVIEEAANNLENQDEKEQEVYFNFINSIKSQVSKKNYQSHIDLYLRFCNLTKLSDLLFIQEPQKQIIKYIMSLRQRGLATGSISTMINSIYHFYDMNDVSLNKKKINMFKGEFTRKVVDRPYTHDELKKEPRIKDIVEPSDNPWDQGKSIIGLGNKTKLTPLEKEIKKLKDRIKQEKDLDIKLELIRGNIVQIIEEA